MTARREAKPPNAWMLVGALLGGGALRATGSPAHPPDSGGLAARGRQRAIRRRHRRGGSVRLPSCVRRRREELHPRDHGLGRGAAGTSTATAGSTSIWSTARRCEPRAGGLPRAALFRNNGDRTFRDVTAAAGVGNERWGQGVCAGDVDNDGASDLYVTNFGPNRLFRNLGDGRFADVAVRAGVAVDSWSTGCAFGDYDGDGWLDLYVAGYVAFDVQNPPPSPPRRQDSPAQAAAPQGRGGMGAAYSEWRGVLHLSRAAGDVRPARAPRRARSSLPQQSRRHLHRDDAGRRE